MKAKLILATLDNYPAIQNMARFYVYEMSRECGLHSTVVDPKNETVV